MQLVWEVQDPAAFRQRLLCYYLLLDKKWHNSNTIGMYGMGRK